MKFKKIFFILFLMLLIINCKSVSARTVCKYVGNLGDDYKLIIKGKEYEAYIYNQKVNVDNIKFKVVFPDFDFTEYTKCPKLFYRKIFKNSKESIEECGNKNCIYLYVNKQEEPGFETTTFSTELYLVTSNSTVTCGTGQGIITGIPGKIPELTSFVFTLIQVAVPVILVIMGSIDLFKGITAQKEDEIKKGRQMFIKRLAVAAIIYFVVIIVKFLISIIADTNVSNMVDCIDCFVSNNCN